MELIQSKNATENCVFDNSTASGLAVLLLIVFDCFICFIILYLTKLIHIVNAFTLGWTWKMWKDRSKAGMSFCKNKSTVYNIMKWIYSWYFDNMNPKTYTVRYSQQLWIQLNHDNQMNMKPKKNMYISLITCWHITEIKDN